MSIKNLGRDKWKIDISLGYDAAGKQRRHKVIFEGTQANAVIFEIELARQLGKPSVEKRTIAGFAEEYLATCTCKNRIERMEGYFLFGEVSTYRGLC